MKWSWWMVVAGFGLFAIMVVVSFFIEDPDLANLAQVVGAILGAAIAGAAIFGITSWPVPVRLLVHTGAMLGIVLPCLAFSGWFDLGGSNGVIALLGTYVSLGIAGWSIALIVMHYANERRSKQLARERQLARETQQG